MTAQETNTISVLFVCLGNICRSPLAEGVFQRQVEERGLDHRFRIDSAGTGAWHVGEPPDARSAEVAMRNGIRLNGTARQVTPDDLASFDLVVAMDSSNHRDIDALRDDASNAELCLLREFDPAADGDLDVPDPYYGGPGGFDDVYDMVTRSCAALLEHMIEEREDLEPEF